MRRREFITLIGSAAAWPLAARAQQPAMPVIGYLSGKSPEAEAPLREPFIKALKASGFAAGSNVAIEYRFAQGQDDRLPALTTDLVRERPAVLVAMDTGSALAAKAATKTIPIVFGVGADPVRLGLVETLNRPGGNATGIYVYVTDLGPKRLQLLREVVPQATLIACIVNLKSANGPTQKSEFESVAQAIGQQVLVLSASTESEVDEAFATIAARKADAIVYGAGVFFQVVRDRLVALAARLSIPAIYEWPEFATAGGLMSYSPDRRESNRQIGNYTGQILKGAKPADLPVFQSSKFELVINLRTAKALGLTIPPGVLAIADAVIE
jgi:putative ABC transport system substrate-binding protein